MVSTASCKIVIADDHPLFRSALCQAIRQGLGDVTLLECDSIKKLEETLATQADIDLVLLDLHMPGANGFSGLVLVRREHPEIPVVIVSASEELNIIHRAIDYGASGFIPKSADLPTIGKAIESVLQGNIWLPDKVSESQLSDNERNQEEKVFAERIRTLTPQQLRVFMMLTKGLLNKQIASEVSVSEATVRTHMTAIFRKLGVRNRTQAVLAANYLTIDSQKISS